MSSSGAGGAARRRHPIPAERWPDAAQAATSRLFSPLTLASGLRLRHRTWVPAMVPWRATEDGFVTDAVLDWYRRFAEGRPAVLVVEATGIRDVPSGPLLRIGDDRFVPGLAELTRTVADASEGHTRLLIQVLDFLTIRRRPERERYLGRFLALTAVHRAWLAERAAASGRQLDPADDAAVRAALLALPEDELPQVLSAREWSDFSQGYREHVGDTSLPHVADLPRRLPALFADASHRARSAGFDGVELHYAHAYTMAGVLSRLNDRDDGYGGSPDARLRLPLEVYAAVRAAVGADFTVGVRFLGDEIVAGGSRLPDAVHYGRGFARAGFDVLSISCGGKFEDARQPRVGEAAYPYTGPSGHACMPSVFGDAAPFGRNLGLSAAIRGAIREEGLDVPVVGAGGINGFELAERALREGQCDLVAAARQSLADPDWFEKMRTGRGASIARCLYTNYCEALDQQHREVTCQLWDRVRLDDDAPRSADGRRRLVAPRGDWEPRIRPR